MEAPTSSGIMESYRNTARSHNPETERSKGNGELCAETGLKRIPTNDV
jgi:hypothetical protein